MNYKLEYEYDLNKKRQSLHPKVIYIFYLEKIILLLKL